MARDFAKCDVVINNVQKVIGTYHAPYGTTLFFEITEEEYNEWMDKTVHEIDWDLITDYEKEDMTENTKELACTAGACEIL